jgi:hypothetical protein
MLGKLVRGGIVLSGLTPRQLNVKNGRIFPLCLAVSVALFFFDLIQL